MRTLKARWPGLEHCWLTDLRKAVKNILGSKSRTAARGTNFSVVNEDDFLKLCQYAVRKLEADHALLAGEMFAFGTELAEIVTDRRTGAPTIQILDYNTFKARLNEIAVFRKSVGQAGAYQGVSVPDDVARFAYARRLLNVPNLVGVIRSPIFTAAGKLITTPGYHKESGSWPSGER